MDYLSHSLSGQSQATPQQPQLHRRSRASALRIEGRLSRRIFRRRSQYRASSDLRGYLCALADRTCRDPGKSGNVQLFHGARAARNFAAPQEIATHRTAAAWDSREFPAPANFRSQTGAALSRPLFVSPRPALCLTMPDACNVTNPTKVPSLTGTSNVSEAPNLCLFTEPVQHRDRERAALQRHLSRLETTVALAPESPENPDLTIAFFAFSNPFSLFMNAP